MKIEFDNALNEAGWALVRELNKYGDISGNMFNNLKPSLKIAIERYMSEKEKEQPIPQTNIETLEEKEVEWVNVDELPPVGCEIMTSYTDNGCDDWCDFHGPSVIIAYHGDYVWVAHHGKFNRVHELCSIDFEKVNKETPTAT